MGTNRKPSAVLGDIVASDHEFRRLVLDIYRNRSCLFVVGFVWLFTTIFAPGDRMQDATLPWRAIYNAGGILFYYMAGYLLLPSVLRWGLSRNIPFVWVNSVFYMVLAGVETAFFLAVFPDSDGFQVLYYWLTTIVMIVISVSLLTYYFEDTVRKRLSRQPELLPLWRPLTLPDSNLELLLPQDVRAPVRRIEAQNQYVRVLTRTGEALLRMSLNEAEGMLPANDGLRIHRSIWMHKNEMEELFFHNGNPRLRNVEKQVFPVSRKKVDELRRILESKQLPVAGSASADDPVL